MKVEIERKFSVGQRVYYIENGPTDVGTVKGVTRRSGMPLRYDYRVAWDNGDPMDEYCEGQLTAIEGFATAIRRQYRRGLMTKLEYETELGLITPAEFKSELLHLKLRTRVPRKPRVARKANR